MSASILRLRALVTVGTRGVHEVRRAEPERDLALGGRDVRGDDRCRAADRRRLHAREPHATGADDEDAGPAHDVSQWLAGVAVDRTLPLRSMLITAETFAERPLDDDADLAWTIGGGVRMQRSPRLAVDAGLGRRVTGPETGWYVTFGGAYAFAIRSLMPGGAR